MERHRLPGDGPGSGQLRFATRAGSLTISPARGQAVLAVEQVRLIVRPCDERPTGPFLVSIEEDLDDEQLPWPDSLDARTRTSGPWLITTATPLRAMTELVDQLERDDHVAAYRLRRTRGVLAEMIEHSRHALGLSSDPAAGMEP